MGISLRGVNLAGAGWAYNPTVPPVEGTHYKWVSHQDIDYLASKGVSFGRLLFSWEILQPNLGGALDATYESTLRDRVNYATGKGMHIMIEPHGGLSTNFARYKGNPVGSAAVPNSAFADLWARLAQLHKGNSKVSFGLTNEPNDISTVQWFAAAQAAVNAIRSTGATNLIMVPGNGFSQPGTWNQTFYDTANPPVSNATGWAMLQDPLDNMVVSVHTYFDTNGGGVDVNDIAGPNIIGQRLQPVVDWARARGLKVHLSEFGARAGAPGAQAAVANAIAYMNTNSDVMIGWAWWTYGPPSFWGSYAFTLCPTNNYMDDDPKTAWLTPHFNAPAILYLRDNAADTGSEPNSTTTTGWESQDIWVRQIKDDIEAGEYVKGGQPCYVYVRIRNKGVWPSTGSQIVRLYWAKAAAGLSYPQPWNGLNQAKGGSVGSPRPISPIAGGQSKMIAFPWTAPDPLDYLGDGHFCLLACIATTESPLFEGFVGTDLNQNVLNLSKVAWRNIHIVAIAKLSPEKRVGDLVVSNQTAYHLQAQVTFEILGASGLPIHPPAGTILITPQGAARERLREAGPGDRPFVEDMGHGVFRILDITEGLSHLEVRPEEELPFTLEYTPDREAEGYAVRAVQFALDGASRKPMGGQTFVAGEVEGFTTRKTTRRRRPCWPWLTVLLSFLMLILLLGRGRKKR